MHGAGDQFQTPEEIVFRQIAETIREVFWVGSPDWSEIHYVSPAYEEVWGRSCQSLYDDPDSWFKAVHADDREPVRRSIRRMIDGGDKDPEFPECRISRPDRTTRWILARAYPIRDESGRVIRIAGIAEDVTRRRIAEETLRESESRLLEAQRMASLGNWLWDVRTGEVEWSAEVYRIFRLDPDEFTPQIDSIMALSPTPEDHQRDQELIRRATESREAGSFEQRFLRPDGSLGYYHSTFQGIYDSTGALVKLKGTVQDITDRKQAEESYRGSTERLRLALQAASMGTWEWDVSDDRVVWSPETLSIFGVSAEDFAGTFDGYLGFSAPGVRDEIESNVRRFLAESPDLSVIQYDHEIVRGDGTTGWIEVRGTLFRDEAVGSVRMTGVCADITDRKRVTEERERLIARLEVQNEELERFTYTVSHDLKSPLITIKGFIGMLAEDLADAGLDSVKDDLARISNAADKMGQLLDELLDLSRIGRLVNPSEDLSLEELAREALGLLQGEVAERDVDVLLQPGLPVVHGDRVRLLEVLQNLIDNAVKYMGNQLQPRIEIGARHAGDETICYVHDNGMGIDPRYHKRIFGLFDQLDPGTNGSGIGLALCKRIIEVHGGRIWVESQGEGSGSTFCFTIPPKSAPLGAPGM